VDSSVGVTSDPCSEQSIPAASSFPVAVERSVDVELGLDAELLLFGEVVRLLARLRFDFG